MDRDYDNYSTHSSDSPGRKSVTTKTTTVMPYDPSSGILPPPGTQEEWTTTKRRVNHKTKQVETRVQRQIIMEDGKVIADSGPQVTTKTTEDQKSDESEDTKHRRLGDSEVPEKYRKDIGNQIVSEKTVTHNVMKEANEENYQYHDESLRDLEGEDIHRRAVKAPHELIRIENEIPEVPRGKLVNFTSKGRKINDRDEVQEVSRLNKDGQLNTETTQTHHHEEYEDDEIPEDSNEAKHLAEPAHVMHKQLEYNNPHYEYDDRRASSRTNSSLSMSRNDKVNKSNSKKWRDERVNSGDESDIIETSQVYKLSDRMRSLKTSGKNSRTTKHKAKKDDASTQASMSDSDDDRQQHQQGKKLLEVNERFNSRRSSFETGTPEMKPKNKYYFGTEPSNKNNDKGYISSNVKTSTFAMENNKVIEDKTFNEDFERSFKDQNERQDAHRDYDRFVEHTKDHTKAVRQRSMSPMLPPPVPNEYIHHPTLVDHSSTFDKPVRSKSFYDHQIQEYESKSHKSYKDEPKSYSTMPTFKVEKDPYQSSAYRARSPSPIRTGTWSKSAINNTNNHYSSDYHHNQQHNYSNYNNNSRRPSYSRSNSRNDFPDFAPLSSPLEIKSLTENSIKSRHHISTYN